MPALPGRPRRALLLAFLVAAGAIVPGVPAAAAGSVYKVNALGDSADLSPGDGVCDSAASPTVVKCTLRAAIEEANADPDDTTIRFKLGGSGVRTITPNSAFPTITEPLTIDGYTQAGSAPNTAATGTNAVILVELDGRYVPQPGLQAEATVTIRGLAIFYFGRGIELAEGANGSRVLGCFIGTDATGTKDQGNDSSGVLVNAEDVRIGTIVRGDRNLISGNTGSGVNIGISAKDALVQNNLIGTGKNGRKNLANEGDGVFISGSRGHLVGGTFPGQGNVIGWNNGDGVALLSVLVSDEERVPGRVRILYNSIFRSGDIAIDLADDGVTANDAVPDPDLGENGLQNFPKIDSAVASGSGTLVKGRIATRPGIDVLIQVFASPSGDPEAKTVLASFTITTAADGKATFSRTVGALAAGTLVTATATDVPRAQTSEVGPARAVTTPS